MSIRLTNKDRMALNELLQVTYSFQLHGSQEKGDANHTQFLLTAPGRTRTWYTVSGTSIVDTVDNWFERIATVEGIRLRRESPLETLQEVKENAAEIIQFYD